jgi:hypothetical protein
MEIRSLAGVGWDVLTCRDGDCIYNRGTGVVRRSRCTSLPGSRWPAGCGAGRSPARAPIYRPTRRSRSRSTSQRSRPTQMSSQRGRTRWHRSAARDARRRGHGTRLLLAAARTGIAAIAHTQCRRARDRHRGISRCRRRGPHGAPARDGAGAMTRPMASDCSPLRIDSRSNQPLLRNLQYRTERISTAYGGVVHNPFCIGELGFH